VWIRGGRSGGFASIQQTHHWHNINAVFQPRVDSYGNCRMYSESRFADAYTTTNNCSQGLDLRSTSKQDEMVPVTVNTRVIPSAPHCHPVYLEGDDNEDTKLQSLVGSGCAASMPPTDRSEYVAQWCKEQRQFTQSASVPAKVRRRKPTSNKTPVDKLIRRFTHPFTLGDKTRLEVANGEIRNHRTNGTLTDVQHNDFVQG